MPPPAGWGLEAGVYSPVSNKPAHRHAGPCGSNALRGTRMLFGELECSSGNSNALRGTRMLFGEYEDATLEGLGTERRANRNLSGHKPTCGD
jgi:hypothetical protein